MKLQSRNHSSSSLGLGGFSLIELLVCLWIIAVLACILFPVFAQAKGGLGPRRPINKGSKSFYKDGGVIPNGPTFLGNWWYKPTPAWSYIDKPFGFSAYVVRGIPPASAASNVDSLPISDEMLLTLEPDPTDTTAATVERFSEEPVLQKIEEKTVQNWNWNVTPHRTGDITLILTAFSEEGGVAVAAAPKKQIKIHVEGKPKPKPEEPSFFVKNADSILVALIGIPVAIIGAYFTAFFTEWFNKRRNRSS